MPRHMSAFPLIRSAQPHDAEGICQLLASVGWFYRYASEEPTAHAERVRELIAQAGERSLLLVAHDRTHGVVGYCATHWQPLAILQGWEGYVSELFVSDAVRGQGIGRKLLQAATEAARARGCTRIWLVNSKERPSYKRGFYAQQGWSEHPQLARFALNLETATL